MIVFACIYRCNGFRVRFDNGSEYEGKVEIQYYDDNSTVCVEWIQNNTQVVHCKELDFEEFGEEEADYYEEDMNGTIWFDSVNCNGTELALEQCTHSGWESTQNVGVKCNSLHINETKKKPQFFCDFANFQLIEERHKMPTTATLRSTRIVFSDYNNTTIIINNHITNTNNSLIVSIISVVISAVSAIATVVLAIVGIKKCRKNSYDISMSINLQHHDYSATDADDHDTISQPVPASDGNEDQANSRPQPDTELRDGNTADTGMSNGDAGYVSTTAQEESYDADTTDIQ